MCLGSDLEVTCTNLHTPEAGGLIHLPVPL